MFTEMFNAAFTLPAMEDERPIDRVLARAKRLGMNQSKLGERMGVSPQDVTNWKARGMPMEWITVAAKVLSCSADELLGLAGKPEPTERLSIIPMRHRPETTELRTGTDHTPFPVRNEAPEFAGTARQAKFVPVVGTARMGDDGFYEEISSVVGAGDGHIEIQTEDPNAYGLRVRGQSMFPAIRDGWYVLVEPNGQPREGEYVLLKLLDGRKMVKELMYRRPGSVEVMSVNGGARMTFDKTELQDMQAVGAVVSPSKWRPD